MLKKFKDQEGFIKNAGLTRSTMYFKIGLYECFKKFLALKNLSLSCHYYWSKQSLKVMKNYSHEEELYKWFY